LSKTVLVVLASVASGLPQCMTKDWVALLPSTLTFTQTTAACPALSQLSMA
jgi:hypothetical protein